MRSNTGRILVAAFSLLAIFSSPAFSAMDQEKMRTVLKNIDTLSKDDIQSALEEVSADYVYPDTATCITTKSAHPADAERDTEFYRNLLQVTLECKIRFFKKEQAFLKKADAKAKKEIERIFSRNASTLTPGAAKEAVLLAMDTIPRSKRDRVTQNILMMVGEIIKEESASFKSYQYQANRNITSVESLFSSTEPVIDPVVVYRAAKKEILLSNDVWQHPVK